MYIHIYVYILMCVYICIYTCVYTSLSLSRHGIPVGCSLRRQKSRYLTPMKGKLTHCIKSRACDIGS